MAQSNRVVIKTSLNLSDTAYLGGTHTSNILVLKAIRGNRMAIPEGHQQFG